jgi:hypothetical protein
MTLRKTDAQRRISAKAEAQEGVVSLAQAVEAGMPARNVQRCAWLHSVTTGVYAVGHTKLSQRAYLWVAHLATGGAVCDESAAWDYALLPHLRAPIHVTTTGGARSRKGIVVHHRRVTTTTRDGLPITTVAGTLNHLRPHQLMRALREARYRGILKPDELRGRARHGWERIKVVPAHRTRSELEHLLLDVCDAHAFPHPLVNHVVDGRERDFYWPAHNLVVEMDGPQHRWADDRRRDRDLLARTGIRTVRFTGDDGREEVAQTLGAVFVS